MKIYLKSLITKLSNYNRKLDTESLFVDKLWSVIDEKGNHQSFVFESNGDLTMSNNGKVKMGKWKFFTQAKSIRIDRGNGDIIFLNHDFFVDAVMIFKYDGSDNNDLLVLADKMKIPNLDVISYLKKIDYENRQIKFIELLDGSLLTVENGYDKKELKRLNVKINESDANNGYYFDKNKQFLFQIEQNIIVVEAPLINYTSKNNGKIIIAHRIKGDYYIGDLIFDENLKPLQNGNYKIKSLTKTHFMYNKISVKDGKII